MAVAMACAHIRWPIANNKTRGTIAFMQSKKVSLDVCKFVDDCRVAKNPSELKFVPADKFRSAATALTHHPPSVNVRKSFPST